MPSLEPATDVYDCDLNTDFIQMFVMCRFAISHATTRIAIYFCFILTS